MCHHSSLVVGRLMSLYVSSLIPCCGSPGVVICVITHPLLWVAWCRYMCHHSSLAVCRLVSLYVSSLIPCCVSSGVVICVITHPLLWIAWCRCVRLSFHHLGKWVSGIDSCPQIFKSASFHQLAAGFKE